MMQNDALCEACCRQHGRIFETCNNGCHIRDLFEKLKAELDTCEEQYNKLWEYTQEKHKQISKLTAERDAAVAYLEELCDAFGNMTRGCECCPLNDSENCDEDGNAPCKVWNSVE